MRHQLRRKDLVSCKLEMQSDQCIKFLSSAMNAERSRSDALKSVLRTKSQNSHMSAAHSFTCVIRDLERSVEQREVELRASELAREQLETNIEHLELQQRQSSKHKKTGGDVLIEEVATLKLQSLQDRRRILSLQQSRQQAEAMLASHEAMLSIADRARVEAETCVLLGVPTQPDETLAWVQQSHMRALGALRSTLALEDSAAENTPNLDELRATEKSNRSAIELGDELRKAQKAEADANDQRQTAIHHACELGRALDYYEESSTGIPPDYSNYPALMKARDFVSKESMHKHGLSVYERGDLSRGCSSQKRQLQQTASATISSLKALLEEKTRALEKAYSALQDLRQNSQQELGLGWTDRTVATEKSHQQHANTICQLRNTTTAINNMRNTTTAAARPVDVSGQRLSAELEQLYAANQKLERKLKMSSLARERAESNCAQAIREGEAQKADLIAVAKQLQDAEDKRVNFEDKSNQMEVTRLKKLSAEKDARLRGLKESLLKLKTQFVISEQANSFKCTRRKYVATDVSGSDGQISKNLETEVSLLTQELRCIRTEAKATRRELDATRSQRDKYKLQFDDILIQVDRLRSDSRISESRCRKLDDSLMKTRRECRDLRISEAK